MEKRLKNIARLLLVVFLFFYCGNTLFIHTHIGEAGNRIVHSHPYFPNSQHSHSSNALWLIAFSNAALSAAQSSEEITLPNIYELVFATLTYPRYANPLFSHEGSTSGLDPPLYPYFSIAAILSL